MKPMSEIAMFDSNLNAVCVRSAVKQYGSKRNPYVILDGLNMTVPTGSIYALLGSNGSGKTTLLNCIVGRVRLNSGEIKVLGGEPGSKRSGVPGPRIGYMPQEIALYGEFTIKETFKYFGWINGMQSKHVRERMDFFVKFLTLPSENTLIKKLSGGQQRCVSLAVALLHDAELLILDEPTVGVDPIIRESIWEYLHSITRSGEKTIIITSHYVQETTNVTKIAFLRGGCLLAETSPSRLLKRFKTESLEEVFLKLSLMQNMGMKPTASGIDNLYRDTDEGGLPRNIQKKGLIDAETPDQRKRFSEQDSISVLSKRFQEGPTKCLDIICLLYKKGHLKALIWKNFLWMWRHYLVVLCIICVPISQIILYCLAIGHDIQGLSLAVVNFELNNGEICNDTFDCNSNRQSCVYLNYLKNKSYIINYYKSEEDSKQAVHRGKSWASLTFRSGYSKTIEKRLTHPKKCSDDEIVMSQFDVYQDLSDINIGYQVSRDVQHQFIDYAKYYIQHCTVSRNSPYFFHEEQPIYGVRDPKYSDAAAPGIMLSVIFFVACALTTGALLMERKNGILQRSLVNGITAIEILTSHIIAQFAIVFLQAICMVVLALYAFQITHEGPVYLIYMLVILAGVCGMAFGFTVAAFVDTERMATYLSLGSFFPNVMLCGIIWPIDGMPYWLRQIAYVLPLTESTEALQLVLHRGWGMQHYDVYIGFISLCIWCAIFLMLSGLGLRFRKN